MNTYTNEQLLNLLRHNECVVEFTKVNGELRTMPCTLKADLIPPDPVVEGRVKQEKKSNPEILNVWCTDKKAWRSFRISNVISVNAKTEDA